MTSHSSVRPLNAAGTGLLGAARADRPRPRRLRTLSVGAGLAVVVAAGSVLGSGTASALPRNCAPYATALANQLSYEDFWLGEWVSAVANQNWGELHTDVRQYSSAVAGYNRVVAQAEAAGC